MLTSCVDLAHEQSLHIVSLKAALQDTVPWDTSICPRPSSSSTPSLQTSWAEVVIRDRKRLQDATASPPAASRSEGPVVRGASAAAGAPSPRSSCPASGIIVAGSTLAAGLAPHWQLAVSLRLAALAPRHPWVTWSPPPRQHAPVLKVALLRSRIASSPPGQLPLLHIANS
ncbi:hypothetical protein ABVT39_006560 [Epinephelus coioides]